MIDAAEKPGDASADAVGRKAEAGALAGNGGLAADGGASCAEDAGRDSAFGPEGVAFGLEDAACGLEDVAFDPVAYINTPRWQRSELGLGRMAELLERLGRPQDALRFLHVAGTNGKGSVCAYADGMLRAAGLKVGLFTSPYVRCFEERIRVDGENISQEDLRIATAPVRAAAEAMEAQGCGHPTEFELMLAVALVHFARCRCQMVVLEVGLGGRLDATNVIDAPDACVIARIGADHTDLLGTTLSAIAAEKAGIVKAGAQVVSWPQDPEAMEVVERACSRAGCALAVPDFSQLEVGPLEIGGAKEPLRSFAYRGRRYCTRLLGSYQPFNAAVAVEAMEALRRQGWDIADEAVAAGIAAATWPGRFDVVAMEPMVILDGGHNPQGAAALVESLEELKGAAGAPRAVLAMGVLADKDWRAMVDILAPAFEGVVCFAPPNPRALDAESLAQAFGCVVGECETAADASCALARAQQLAGPEGIAVLAGSLYSLGEVLR